MKFIASPNYNERAPGTKVRYVILHYTNMENHQVALEHLINPAHKVSAHYLLDEGGSVTQLVDESKRAWHAGKSFWRGDTDINSLSIGIEIVNPGHTCGYRPFPEAQIDALARLLRDIFARHEGLVPANVLAHSDIAPLRKMDPGELFPWTSLAEKGFGLWPHPTPEDTAPLITSDETEWLLREIGYDCPPNDPEKARAALTAFQRHFVPAHLGAEAHNVPTLAMLRATARLMAEQSS